MKYVFLVNMEGDNSCGCLPVKTYFPFLPWVYFKAWIILKKYYQKDVNLTGVECGTRRTLLFGKFKRR